MNTITANELKTRGVSLLEESLRDEPEAMISVRGREKYVVMRVEQYHRLREMELEAALLEARQELADGKGRVESAEAHVWDVFHP